jgi:hypothetical protein
VHNTEFKYIDGYFQVHHLIPREIFYEKNDAYELLKLAGLAGNEHFLENLSSLPITACLPGTLTEKRTPMRNGEVKNRTPHSGSHPKYTSFVGQKLAEIYATYTNATERKSDKNDTAHAAKLDVLTLLEFLRNELYSGILTLE